MIEEKVNECEMKATGKQCNSIEMFISFFMIEKN